MLKHPPFLLFSGVQNTQEVSSLFLPRLLPSASYDPLRFLLAALDSLQFIGMSEKPFFNYYFFPLLGRSVP